MSLLDKYAVYQIYPASFCDSNNDGWGDIQGIISRLDYIASLGFHLIWISPLYVSPMVDMGYDIADYYNIDPRFGTMADFDELIAEARKRDIKIIMDLVVNHTSDQCAWFLNAVKNPSSPYRNWYIFKQGKGKKHRRVPNNWTTSFMDSVWTEVENEPGTFYLHSYTAKQPDLNWHNPQVLKEVEKVMNFWLDKGVYGFRCDVISEIYKESYRDGKRRKLSEMSLPKGHEHFIATKGCHRIIQTLRHDVIEPRHGILIGECFGVTDKNAKDFEGELDAMLSFEIAHANGTLGLGLCKPKKVKEILQRWQSTIDFNGNYFENHDQHRSVSKYVKKGGYQNRGAKMLLTLLYSLKGSTFVYMGQELGLTDYPKLNLSESNDFVAKKMYGYFHSLIPFKPIAWKLARSVGRDDARYPFPFRDIPGQGFTSEGVVPWQKFNSDISKTNAESERLDSYSVSNFVLNLNRLKAEHPALQTGSIKFLDSDSEVLYLLRESIEEKLLITINLSDKEKANDVRIKAPAKDLLLSNIKEVNKDVLQPYETDVYKLH